MPTGKRDSAGSIDATANGLVWAILMLPAPLFAVPPILGLQPWRVAMTPTGVASVGLLTVALAISPLLLLFPRSSSLLWLVRHRRAVGVAAFSYAALHLAVFIPAVGRLDYILLGMAYPSMWTGWISFALLALLAATSNGLSLRRLGVWWKQLHRIAYVAALLAYGHWLLLTSSTGWAAYCGATLTVLQALRLPQWYATRRKHTGSIAETTVSASRRL